MAENMSQSACSSRPLNNHTTMIEVKYQKIFSHKGLPTYPDTIISSGFGPKLN
jgi:hypothetical protein